MLSAPTAFIGRCPTWRPAASASGDVLIVVASGCWCMAVLIALETLVSTDMRHAVLWVPRGRSALARSHCCGAALPHGTLQLAMSAGSLHHVSVCSVWQPSSNSRCSVVHCYSLLTAKSAGWPHTALSSILTRLYEECLMRRSYAGMLVGCWQSAYRCSTNNLLVGSLLQGMQHYVALTVPTLARRSVASSARWACGCRSWAADQCCTSHSSARRGHRKGCVSATCLVQFWCFEPD
jgi:hypothetical protein